MLSISKLATIDECLDILVEAQEVLDNYGDVDGDRPNRALSVMYKLDKVIQKLENLPEGME